MTLLEDSCKGWYLIPRFYFVFSRVVLMAFWTVKILPDVSVPISQISPEILVSLDFQTELWVCFHHRQCAPWCLWGSQTRMRNARITRELSCILLASRFHLLFSSFLSFVLKRQVFAKIIVIPPLCSCRSGLWVPGRRRCCCNAGCTFSQWTSHCSRVFICLTFCSPHDLQEIKYFCSRKRSFEVRVTGGTEKTWLGLGNPVNPMSSSPTKVKFQETVLPDWEDGSDFRMVYFQSYGINGIKLCV